MVPLVPLLILALLAFIVWAIYRALRAAMAGGRVVAVDLPGSSPLVGRVASLHSERYGLRGRPDELRRSEDGRLVPVEVKSSKGPTHGGAPFLGHRLQLYAYCALVEDSYGASPPYGMIIYRDGNPRRIPWNDEARGELIAWVERLRQPYHGEATPSWPKCAHCLYRTFCPSRST